MSDRGDRPRNPTYNPYAPPPRGGAAESGDSGGMPEVYRGMPEVYGGPDGGESSATGGGRRPQNPEAVRRELIGHETEIRSMALVLYLVAFGSFVGGGLFGLVALRGGEVESLALAPGPADLLLGALAIFYLWLGRGLRNLEPRVRLPAILLSFVGLAGFPLGTIYSGYFLYLLLSSKGNRILSEDYQRIVARTPQVRGAMPAWIKVAVVGLLITAVYYFFR